MKESKIITIAIGLWAIYALSAFSIVGGLIWIAIHFLRKVW